MRVVVVGGGLAGLFAASELISSGIGDVTVLEAAGQPGGLARTIERDGFSLEPAAGSFPLPHPNLSPILSRAGVETLQAAGASLRLVYVNGRLVPLRPSPAALLAAPVLSIGAKMRALAEPLITSSSRPADETLAGFCQRRFGPRAGFVIASLMAAGVFAGDPDELSVAAAFPMLDSLETEHGSVVRGAFRRHRDRLEDAPRTAVHVPKRGMASMAASVAASLGGRFHGDFAAGQVRREGGDWVVDGPERARADALVLAVSPRQAADLLGGEIADVLRGNVAAEVAVVGVGGSRPSPLPDGFGALIGPSEGMITVGALLESSYAPHRAPQDGWLAKIILGGAGRRDVSAYDDDQVASTAIHELGTIVDTELSPEFVEVVRHRPGIPQYVTGHQRWLDRLEELRPPGLYLAGWGYRGVGVAALAADAVSLAGRINQQGV